jgi:DNA-binding MarR family transcriptional regulator
MTISRAVAGLATRRLVDRVQDSADRRTLRLSPTDEGRRIHDIVAPEALKVEARLLAALSPGEAEALRTALAHLRSACDEP